MTETKYWQALRKKIKSRLAYVWKVNANYEAGVPDWYASDKTDWWVENKRVPLSPPSVLDLTNHKKYLTMNQQFWLLNRHNEGRNVGVIVFSKEGHLWLPHLEWQKPITRDAYMDRAMTMPELADKMVDVITGQR